MEPSPLPQFTAICFKGISQAFKTISYPTLTSSVYSFLPIFNRTFSDALTNATPPPKTIPSSIAAFVAFTASSIFSFKYLISVSVAAPTRITATPPVSFAILSSIFSTSNFDLIPSFCFFNSLTRASISAFLPFPPIMTVLSFLETTRPALPREVKSKVSSFKPKSSETTSAPKITAISVSCSFFLSP